MILIEAYSREQIKTLVRHGMTGCNKLIDYDIYLKYQIYRKTFNKAKSLFNTSEDCGKSVRQITRIINFFNSEL